MPRGGRRSGTPGRSYANRSDLRGVSALPQSAAPGQPYGEAGQQKQAQAEVPMASGDLSAAPDHAQAMQDAQDYQAPPVTPIGAVSQRPDEHVMTPPSMPAPQGDDPLLTGVALMNALGSNASPEVKALRNVLSAQQANAAAP